MGQKKREIIFGLVLIGVLAVALISLFVFFLNKTEAVPTCGDGSFYDSCSIDKPYYCDTGILKENVAACGCPEAMIKLNGICTSAYQTDSKYIFLNYTLRGETSEIGLAVYGGLAEYVSKLPDYISYQNGENPLRVDFKLKSLNEGNQREALMPLVKEIEDAAPEDKVEQARIAVNLVQNIKWGEKNETVVFAGEQVTYSRYPYEVLYDGEGLCSEKSDLLAFLLREIGYGVAIFYYPEENHEAVGIKCPVKESVGGTGYCFVETSGSSIITDTSLEYSNGKTLKSDPQVILISEGISLPEGLYEYRDADKIKRIRNWPGPINSYRLKKLEEKYGLIEEYNIG